MTDTPEPTSGYLRRPLRTEAQARADIARRGLDVMLSEAARAAGGPSGGGVGRSHPIRAGGVKLPVRMLARRLHPMG